MLTRTVDDGSASTERAFVYQDGQMVLQFDKVGSDPMELTHRYLWGPQVDQILADEHVNELTAEGDVYWPLTDNLGSVRDLAVSAPNGTVIEKHRMFDSFGNLVNEYNRGDFDGDGIFEVEDIDALIGQILVGGFSEDLNGDGVSNSEDLELLDLDGDGVNGDADDLTALIEDVIQTLNADGNLDGVVDISDYNIWNNNKFTNQMGWEYGDYNADGVVDISDFNEWNNNKFQYAGAGFSTDMTEHIFGFTGRMMDDATGLQNNLNRWYDPAVGRWVSEDPISFAAGDANIYRYVGNGSTNGTDPDGLKVKVRPKDPNNEDDIEAVERIKKIAKDLRDACGEACNEWIDRIIESEDVLMLDVTAHDENINYDNFREENEKTSTDDKVNTVDVGDLMKHECDEVLPPERLLLHILIEKWLDENLNGPRDDENRYRWAHDEAIRGENDNFSHERRQNYEYVQTKDDGTKDVVRYRMTDGEGLERVDR